MVIQRQRHRAVLLALLLASSAIGAPLLAATGASARAPPVPAAQLGDDPGEPIPPDETGGAGSGSGTGSGEGSGSEDADGTANSSGSGGGPLGGLVGAGPLGDVLRDPREAVAGALQQGVRAVMLTVAYTPAPNNMRDYFRAPTNGMWADRWETRQEKARPLFWAIAGLTLLLYLLGGTSGILSQAALAGWPRRWLGNFAAGYLAWTLAGAWLTIRKGLTRWLLQDITAASLEATLSAGLVILLLVVVALYNIWILVTLLLIAGMVYGGVAIITPWLGPLIMLRAFPVRIVSASGDRLAKLWFVLTMLTLPITAFVGAGFSLEVGGMVAPESFAGGADDAAAGAARALASTAVKFGALGLGIVSSWWLFSGLKSVGMASGVAATPSPEQLQQQYKQAREHASQVRERSRTVVDAPREVARGAGGRAPLDPSTGPSRSYDAGRAVRDYAAAAPGPVGDGGGTSGGGAGGGSTGGQTGTSAARDRARARVNRAPPGRDDGQE